MARGHQKFQSQQKNQQKQEKLKKAQSHDQKGAAQKALIFTCIVCKVCHGSAENHSRRGKKKLIQVGYS